MLVFCSRPGSLRLHRGQGCRAFDRRSAISPAQTAEVSDHPGLQSRGPRNDGRTFFELRQITRTVCDSGKPEAPPEVAAVLKELDGHAHR